MAEFNGVRDELILNELPESFTTMELIEIAGKFNIPENTVHKRVIPRFMKKLFIDRLFHGNYIRMVNLKRT